MAALGRKGGKVGGAARANALTSVDGLEVLTGHDGGNRLFCYFNGFLNYLLRLNHVCDVGRHTLKGRAEDL